LGVTYALLNQKDSALYYAEWALKEAKEHKLKKETIDGHHALYDIYLTFKDYEKALLNYSTFIQLMQEDFNMQSAADMANSRAKFEEAKKEVIAAKEVQRQKFIRNTSLLGLVVVCVFAVIFFRQRNNINKQKKRSDELLYNILPEEVAAELKKNGSAEAKQFDEVTVLFTDFKDFTQLSEQMTAKELVEEIHTCFMAFDNIMEKYGIEKIKTIGDSYMCAGGLPLANKTHAADVVNAGLEIQKFILNRVVERTALGKEPFQIRIGIHTGPVVAGIVGIKKFAYDIWGDTVNTASRMESSGEAGKINISETTYELVKDKFSFTHRGKIQAKNKGELGMIFVRKNLRRAHPITRCSPHGYFSAWESSFFKVLLFYVKVYRLRSRHVSYTQPFAENK
jgi:class 3 adenylate cyclase